MPYAQINYSQHTGNGPYPLSATGCLVTAFSNLLEIFGEGVPPNVLNDYFNKHGIFQASPEDGRGTRDDLGWGSVSGYDGNIVVTGTGAGWPPTNSAIVKFAYTHNGRANTHFTLVADHNAHTITDSWDGKVRAPGYYGNPVAYATYERHQPQVVTPPAPAEQPAFTVENIPAKTVDLKVDTHLWDLNQRTWPGLVNHPAGSGQKGTEFQTTAIAHHALGGSYYMLNPGMPQGYNIIDCENYTTPLPHLAAPATAATPPPPAPTSYTANIVDGIRFEAYEQPKRYYVSKDGGANKWNFAGVKSWRDFKSVSKAPLGTEIYIVGAAHHPIPPNGADYYMIADDFGNFKKTGKVTNQYGYAYEDLSTTKPVIPATAAPPVTPVVVAPSQPVVTPPAAVSATTAAPTPPAAAPDWRTGYRPFRDQFSEPRVVRYVAMEDYTVTDIEQKKADAPLHKFDYVDISGTFTKDGMVYARPKDAADRFLWYGIPLDPKIIEPYDEVFNPTTTPTDRKATKTLRKEDYLVLGLDEAKKIAKQIEKAWEIIPFKKNKKTPKK